MKTGESWNADFRDIYEKARDIQADHMVDEIMEIVDGDPTIRDDEGNMIATPFGGVLRRTSGEIKNRLDARKWIASKLKPRKYGEKITQEIVNPRAEQDANDRKRAEEILKNPAAAKAARELMEALKGKKK